MVGHFAAVHLEFARSYPDALRFVLAIVYGPEEGQPRIDMLSYWRPVMVWLVERIQTSIESGEFVPRPGATAPRLMRYLINVVHMEVMSSYEEQRFVASDPALRAMLDEGGVDLVSDLVAQFFGGAGVLQGEPAEESNR